MKLDREGLIHDIVETGVEKVDLEELMNLYRESKTEILEELTDKQLLERAKDWELSTEIYLCEDELYKYNVKAKEMTEEELTFLEEFF
jgi:predicted transcriptional regulator